MTQQRRNGLPDRWMVLLRSIGTELLQLPSLRVDALLIDLAGVIRSAALAVPNLMNRQVRSHHGGPQRIRQKCGLNSKQRLRRLSGINPSRMSRDGEPKRGPSVVGHLQFAARQLMFALPRVSSLLLSPRQGTLR